MFEIYFGLVISNFYIFSFVFEIDSRLGILNFCTFIFVSEIDMELVILNFCSATFVFEIDMKLVIFFCTVIFVFEIDMKLVILNFCTPIFVFEIDMESVEQKQLIWETPHLLGLQSAFEGNQVMIETYNFCHTSMRMLSGMHWTKRDILANKRRCSQVWKVSWQ